tara:strand:- start:505 stop:1917 length:1413 start_codon:yes stop_codon:yes gene_type:complete
MAFSISIQPKKRMLVSTLLPIFYQCKDNDPNTTNVIAKCFHISQDFPSVTTQIGGSYRLAPNIDFAGYFKFDASEVFNTLTKWTLNDMYSRFGNDEGVVNSIKNGADIVNFIVKVEFYREYLDTTTGLIIVDPTPVVSNDIFVHEGSPNKKFLQQIVPDNGSNVGAFKFFNTLNDIENKISRYFTNYPIQTETNSRFSNVTIRRDETYSLMFQAHPSQQNDVCPYQMSIVTLGANNLILNSHTIPIPDRYNTQMIRVGMLDIINGLTPIAAEGLAPNKFSNVLKYLVLFQGNTGGGSCVIQNILTTYVFTIDDKCIKNSGYLRFAFKNMLGGFDCVTSNGKYTRKTKNKFEDFEKSLGYFDMYNPMQFGKSNWANQNTETYSVTTHVMRKEYAVHFAEMFSSTNVYLKTINDSGDTIIDSEVSFEAREQPFWFVPIIIKGATLNIEKSNENYATLKFNFEMAVNQRNPRY